MDLVIVAVLVAAIFGAAGSRVARAHSRPGWLGFLLAALVPPLGAVAAVWALAVDLPPARPMPPAPSHPDMSHDY